GKVSTLRRPKKSAVETVPPCGIVGGGRYSLTFLSRCIRRSLPPVGQQLVQLDASSSIVKSSGHIHAQAHAGNRRARRNASGDVKGKPASADFSLVCLACEQASTHAIAAIAVHGNELVESIVFAGVDIDSRRAR